MELALYFWQCSRVLKNQGNKQDVQCASTLQTEIRHQAVLHLGTELRTATQAEARVGCGCAQAALAPCWCCQAAAERQLVPADGKGWERNTAPGRHQPAAAILCTETVSPLHMQLRCCLSYSCSKAVLVLTKRALLQWSQGIWRKEVFNSVSSMKQDNDNCVKLTLMHTEVGPVKLQDFYHCV